MKLYCRLIVFVISFLCLNFQAVGKGLAQGTTPNQYQVVVDPQAHQRFGLYYPVTYSFQIPDGLTALGAQYRYSQAEGWNDLPVRTATDFFNGVNAVRFDELNHVAYLSVAFPLTSDVIYLRVLDGSDEVPITYLGIPPYYDNRQAAVTVTLDDWNSANATSFITATQVLASAQVHFTVGIETSSPDWSTIQQSLNSGFMEVASHSRDHPCNENDYVSLGYASQIQGSRDDILTNLSLPYPYVPAYLEPCGFENAQVRQNIVAAGYLATRGYPVPPVQNNFSSWGSDGSYQRVTYSYDTWNWGWYDGTPQLRDEANSSFDTAYHAGGIYHLLDHPWQQHWDSTSYLLQHIAYISGRNDVWYAGFGELYLYHYVQERGQVTVSPVSGDAAFGFYSGPVFLNPGYRWDIHVAEMYNPANRVCLQYNVNGGENTSIACECNSPQCNSSTGGGMWSCTISTNYNYATIAWDISNWTAVGGNACIAKSAQGPTGTFTTSPTVITLANFKATSGNKVASFAFPAGLLGILLGMAFSWRRVLRRSQRLSTD